MKKVLAILKAAAIAASMVQPALAAGKDTLVVASQTDVTTFDPVIDTNNVSVRVQYLIFETLWKGEQDGSYSPVLATEWNWEDDTHLAITLREGVTFHNGNPFNAEDVMYTLERNLNGAFPQYFQKIDFEQSEIVDDTHINLVFTDVDATIMYYLGNVGTGAIVDKETCEAAPDDIATKPMGTGPYVFDSWTVGDSVTVTANENYWGEKAQIAKIIFRCVGDATQRTIELETGGVDFAYDVSYLDAEGFDTNRFEVAINHGSIVNNLFFNSDEGHKMADENIRKAVAYCIDKEALALGLSAGAAETAWSVVSEAQIGYNDALTGNDPYPQDFEKAKECLAEAGYPDGITLRVVFSDSTDYNNMVEILQNWFAQGGITLEQDKSDFGTALSTALDRSGDWDIFILGNGSSSALITLSWFDKNQGAPFAQFVDDGIYSILGEMYGTTDTAVQNEKANEAQMYISDHVGAIPVACGYSIQVYDKALTGIEYADTVAPIVDFTKASFN